MRLAALLDEDIYLFVFVDIILAENRPFRVSDVIQWRWPVKGVLADHLSLPDALLERAVFPDSGAAPKMRDLIHS